MNEASRRFVLRALKWVLIPFLLFFVGYYLLWPLIADKLHLNDKPMTLEETADENPAHRE